MYLTYHKIFCFLNRLPSRVSDLPILVVRRHEVDNSQRDFTLHRHHVLEAVLWLKTNNPHFKDVAIESARKWNSNVYRYQYIVAST